MPPQPFMPAGRTVLVPHPASSSGPACARPTAPVAWKSLALPSEHGGWGLLVEPLLLGLALAPTWAGLALAVAALAAFLARHPLRLALADARRGMRYPRTRPAQCLALGYGTLALAGAGAALYAAPWSAYVPLLCAAPLGLVQLAYDARNHGRQLLPELAGGAALAATAPTILLLGGGSPQVAAGLALLLVARVCTSVLYVRARLRATRGVSEGRTLALAAHALGLLLVLALVTQTHVPASALLAFGVLAARAFHGLLAAPTQVRPQTVGFQELGYGAVTTVLLALGYLLRLS